jgi:hypothetical protein
VSLYRTLFAVQATFRGTVGDPVAFRQNQLHRVKGTAGGVTTVHIGAYFEWTGSTSTMKKCYNAGGARVAVRTGSSILNFILSDTPSLRSGHAYGSTSAKSDSNGVLLTDNRYGKVHLHRVTLGARRIKS